MVFSGYNLVFPELYSNYVNSVYCYLSRSSNDAATSGHKWQGIQQLLRHQKFLYNVTLFSRREYSGMKIVLVLLLLGVDHLSQISRTLRSGILFVVNAKTATAQENKGG